ncbi:hypothetical protein JTE90_012734 [Oedothorax gibbosus]|uniref:Uncharacterized protein n=1 Tax=Oedothorax gibbosus TaxID=931172 RepID=A0AAV6W0D6_9ARAC|nr:hypothetical protein JTE90_012734 [Oedothorax gibbosus]
MTNKNKQPNCKGTGNKRNPKLLRLSSLSHGSLRITLTQRTSVFNLHQFHLPLSPQLRGPVARSWAKPEQTDGKRIREEEEANDKKESFPK